MYGIVNKAIEELVIENFGEDKWQAIKENAGVDVDFFISSEPYDDDVTYKLAKSVSEVMDLSINEVLFVFGEWWILRTGKEKYGSLMSSGGDNFKDFIVNLPLFHNRVMMIYPKLTPPEFKVTNIESNSLHLHYISQREGLREFTRGLISGLSKFFSCETQIELIKTRENGHSHEVFKISW
ncbi:MAG: heme NO-binding domain-containing protein [Cytophagales bacterium]